MDYIENWTHCEHCNTSYTDADCGCSCSYCKSCGEVRDEDSLDAKGVCTTCNIEAYEETHTCCDCGNLAEKLTSVDLSSDGSFWRVCDNCHTNYELKFTKEKRGN